MDNAALDRAKATLGNWRWRLSNLYYITDKYGKRVKFEMNSFQERLFDEMHFMNVVLKSRQLGCTTFVQLFQLDACLFNSNTKAGTIAHNLNDAKAIFADKVRYPYDNLPDQIKQRRYPLRDSAFELALSNNSSIRVGTSLRSGTLNYLHISEYAKLCAKAPDRAREVRTGALNTIQAGQVVTVESTAEGQDGDFYRICQEAQSLQRTKAKLTPLDWKFFFFPWHEAPEYRIDPGGVPIPAEYQRYFEGLEEKHCILLDAGQKAWYVKKAASQLEDMKREFPSTPGESFEASVEGSYYGELIAKLELRGRIGKVEAAEGVPVNTSWDIGHSDATAIWFWQAIFNEIRLVAYFENCGEGMPYYADFVKEMYQRFSWSREGAVDVVPHDARVTEWGSKKTRLEQMIEKGLNPRVATSLSLEDGINAVRTTLPICVFDAENCSEGLKAIKAYRKTWDEARGAWSAQPFHNWAEHGSSSLRYMCVTHREIAEQKKPEEKPPLGTYGDMIQEQLRSAQRARRT